LKTANKQTLEGIFVILMILIESRGCINSKPLSFGWLLLLLQSL